jgi:hypothetical protein
MKLRWLTFFLVVMVINLMPAFAKIMEPTLEELIKKADLIVVGKVAKIHQVGSIKIAEVEIAQTYKGNTALKNILYLATETWACDTSDAKEGETSLLFLTNYYDWCTLPLVNDENVARRNQIIGLIGGRPFFAITVSGRGRMPFATAIPNLQPGQFLVSDSVIFPVLFKIIRYKKPNGFSWGYEQLVKFSVVQSFIQQTLTKSQNTKISSSSLTRNS